MNLPGVKTGAVPTSTARAERKPFRLIAAAAVLLSPVACLLAVLAHRWRLINEDALLSILTLVNLAVVAVLVRQGTGIIAEQAERYKLAVKGSNDGIWDWDVRSGELFWSDRFKEILGIDDPAFVPSYDEFKARLHPEDRDFIVAKLEDHTRTRTPYDTQFRMRLESGDYVWLRGRGMSVWNDKGRATRMTGSVTDITAQKMIEEDLRVARDQANLANQAKSDFLSHMSHELRTPLNSIIGLTRLLYEDRNIGNEQREMARVAYRSGESLLSIVDDLLDISKVESGRLELDNVSFSLPDVINGVMDTMEPLAHDKGLDFSCSFPEASLPFVAGDPARLSRIMINLIDNAIKYTQRGSVSVSIDCQPDGEGSVTLRFDVTDTGIGIPEDKQGVIFEKFTQVDSSITRQFGGTGIGLSVSRELINLMQGRMGMDSQEGAGSHFWFMVDLPVAEGLPADRKRRLRREPLVRLPPEQRKDASRIRLLAAEDYSLNQVFIRKLLARMGMNNVDIVDTGKAAVDAVAAGVYDIILMDCHMPGMSGFDATHEIRTREGVSGTHIPIIAVTADAMPGARERCLRAGMDEYITKPIDPDELKDVMSRWLDFPDGESAGAPSPSVRKRAPVIDVLRGFADTDEELRDLVRAFLDGAQEMVGILEGQCVAGENRAWTEAAHRLKGSAAMIQAEDLRAACVNAEALVTATAAQRNKALEAVKSALKTVTDELVGFSSALH
jgi:PAS domain S-box-containing protein